VQQHGDDLHRLISALGGGAVEVFASSGGAVKGVGAESEAEIATVPGMPLPIGSTRRPCSRSRGGLDARLR
jgi:hypothetical protein